MTGLEQRLALQRVREGLCGATLAATRVLVVGSKAEETMPVCCRLRSLGLNLTCCTSIPEAEMHIEEINLAIVFLDMEHWDHTYHLIKHVKKMRPNCFVIILTGRFDTDHVQCKQALLLGADAIMLKPLTEEQLSMLFVRP